MSTVGVCSDGVMTRRLAALLLVAATGGGAASAQALPDPIPTPIPPSGIELTLEVVADGLTAPLQGVPAPGVGGRIFVADQTGLVWNVDLATGAKSVFLDQSARLVELGVFGPGTFDERGLLGLAFHPDYADNGRFYTYSSEPVTGSADFSTLSPGEIADHQTVIAEWRTPMPADPGVVADPTTRREVLRIDQPQFNHNGGGLNFGPDGELYISLGDGGGADDQGIGHGPDGNGQDATNPLGTVLRIDPLGSDSANGQYGIPGDNPFVSDPAKLDEIHAYGFRNPYRFSFDASTGDLVLADVGQADIEEVNVVTASGNYGWRLKEGTFLFDPDGADPGFVFADSPGLPSELIDPILQYDRDEGLSVIGGFVYRGGALGADLYGKYIFGDFSDPGFGGGRLFAGDLTTGLIAELGVGAGASLAFLLGFGQDADGELYALTSATGTPSGDTGALLRLTRDLTPVPTPAALPLLGGGLFLLGLLRRRRPARL